MDEPTRMLQRCLRQHLPKSLGKEIDMSTELVLLGLDSMSAISLLLDLEDAFKITFRTGDTLLAAVRRLVETQSGAA